MKGVLEMPKYGTEFLNDDVISLTRLNSIRLRYARIANERLRNLEKAERDFWAYDVAVDYTQKAYGKNRFNQSKQWKGTVEGLIGEIQELSKFLNMKTSTVRGHHSVDRKIIKTFRGEKHGLKLNEPKVFFDFLNSAQYKNLANKGITSEQLQEFFDRSTDDNYEIDEIYGLLEEFEKTEMTVEELFNRHGYTTLDE